MRNEQTPWGWSDSVREIASGITAYTTASHGGVKLSAGRMAEFRKLFPNRETFAGGPWFEEDCDWALVVLSFPHEFDGVAIAAAVAMADFIKVPAAFWLTEQGRECREKATPPERAHSRFGIAAREGSVVRGVVGEGRAA